MFQNTNFSFTSLNYLPKEHVDQAGRRDSHQSLESLLIQTKQLEGQQHFPEDFPESHELAIRRNTSLADDWQREGGEGRFVLNGKPERKKRAKKKLWLIKNREKENIGLGGGGREHGDEGVPRNDKKKISKGEWMMLQTEVYEEVKEAGGRK